MLAIALINLIAQILQYPYKLLFVRGYRGDVRDAGYIFQNENHQSCLSAESAFDEPHAERSIASRVTKRRRITLMALSRQWKQRLAQSIKDELHRKRSQ
jgi:hypothetical protein